MRNLQPARADTSRRGSTAGLIHMLASPNQSRYKGLISTPGITKFSAWKRETEIPKIYFHEYLLEKIEEKTADKLWMKDMTNARVENFGHVRRVVKNVASGLTKRGFQSGDVICMYCPNYVDYWIICLAAWSCGGCVMPVNCELEHDMLEHQLRQANAKIIVCDDVNIGEVIDIAEKSEDIKLILSMGCDRKEDHVILVSDLLMDDGKTPPKKLNLKWDQDVVYLPFTSTSGVSKGIMHTHKSLLSCFYSPEGAANHWFDQTLGDSVACGVWFFHNTGLYAFALASIYGLSLYTLSEYSDSAFLDLIVDNKIASAALYPWQIRMLSQSPEVSKYDLSCLKVLATGGSILSATIRMEVLDRIPSIRFVREAYGLNESGIVCLTYPREKKNSVTASMATDTPNDHIMPVGLPNMYSQIKIVDRQSGTPVTGHDEHGEICVKTPQSFIGYLHCPELNDKVFDSDGFFHTGDLGYYDSQGVVYFIEKIENLIHFWMYEVAPSILESRLLSCNNILDAAVVGIPNKENGEVPRAFVVLRPGFEETEENLTNLIESRLQDHERIRGGLYFIQNVPRDENWRVRRDMLMGYKPRTVDEMNKEDEEEEEVKADKVKAEEDKMVSGAGAKAGQSKLQSDKASLGTPAKAASSRSPNLGLEEFVKELEKQPNGTFVASTGPATSPRSRRSAASKFGDRPDGEEEELPQTEGSSGSGPAGSHTGGGHQQGAGCGTTVSGPGGARRRSTDGGSRWNPTSAGRPPGGGKASSPFPGINHGGGGGGQDPADHGGGLLPPLVGSGGKGPAVHKYWMLVKWTSEDLEATIMSHPAVDDCTVQGVHVSGIGELPRAYVVLKYGYSMEAEELLHYVESKRTTTNEMEKLRGGIVFVEKLAKDPHGELYISLDKYNKDAEGMDYEFIRGQPKVKTY